MNKKFTATVFFFSREKKKDRKKANIPSSVYHGVFGHFPIIPDCFKISEAYRRLTIMSEDNRRSPRTKSKNDRLHYCCYIHMGVKYFLQYTDSIFFSGREILVMYSNRCNNGVFFHY